MNRRRGGAGSSSEECLGVQAVLGLPECAIPAVRLGEGDSSVRALKTPLSWLYFTPAERSAGHSPPPLYPISLKVQSRPGGGGREPKAGY